MVIKFLNSGSFRLNSEMEHKLINFYQQLIANTYNFSERTLQKESVKYPNKFMYI